MRPAAQRNGKVSRDEISWLAYELWEEAGRPEGQHEEFWQEAKERLLILRSTPVREAATRELAADVNFLSTVNPS